MTDIVLVTGLSATGKSALSRHLADRGEQAISLDAVDGLCRWQDHAGEPVARPEHPDLAWLRAHEWCWHGPVLDRLIADQRRSGRPRSFLCGTAANQRQFLHRFDLVVMLDVPIEVMLARLDNNSRSNDFGRAGASRQLLDDRFHTDRARLQATSDHIIDATAPIEDVANIICALAATKLHDDQPLPPATIDTDRRTTT